jgi:hypothetical protein
MHNCDALPQIFQSRKIKIQTSVEFGTFSFSKMVTLFWGEVCCLYPEFISRKVTVVNMERIISSFASATHKHQQINRLFSEHWNVLLRRHWILCCLAVPPFFVRRSTKCYLQLNFLVRLRNSATCNNCYTLRCWSTHCLASLLRCSQSFFPSFLFHVSVILTIALIQREDFVHSNSVVTKQQKSRLQKICLFA